MQPSSSPASRLGVSILLIVLYWACHRVPLPFVDDSAVAELIAGLAGRMNLMGISWKPFLASFVVIEGLSFVLPPLRAARSSGVAGRSKLTRYALAVGIVLAAVQSISIGTFLRRATSPTGAALLPSGIVPVATVVALLFAGSLACYPLARAISVAGLGSGFAWLLLADIADPLFQGLARSFGVSTFAQGLVPTLLVAAGVYPLLIRRPEMTVRLDSGGMVKTEYPPVPQGLPPLLIAMVVTVSLTGTIYHPDAVGLLVGVATVLSGLGWALFSSRWRITHALEGLGAPVAGSPEAGPTLLAVVVLAIALAANAVLPLLTLYLLLPLTSVVTVVAILIDLRDEWAFRARHSAVAELVELDNVHLAALLRSLASDAGFAVQVRSLRLRQLFFFVGPIFKMAVLVPSDAEPEARRWLDGLHLANP